MMNDLARRVRQRTAHRTIDRILTAAQQVFVTEGYAAEVSSIVADATVSQATFYGYFESKHDVLQHLIAAHLPEPTRLNADHPESPSHTPFERIETANRAYLAPYRDYQSHPRTTAVRRRRRPTSDQSAYAHTE